MKLFNENELKSDILKEAKILGIPAGSAEAIATKVSEKVTKWASKRSFITDTELNHKIVTELTKFHADLAYVFENRGKII